MRAFAAALLVLATLTSGAQAQTVKDFLAQVTKKLEHAVRTVPADRQYLLCRHRRYRRLHHQDIAGSHPDRYGAAGGNIADQGNIEKLGFKVADIKYILNTHAHFDHTGGFAEMKKDTGAQLVAGERDKPLLEGGYYPGDEKNADLAFPPVKVDRTVNEGDKVTLGDVTLIAHATPGHSPGCTSWETHVKDGDKDRDVVFFCSGTVALNRLVGHPTHPGIVEDYRSTFAKAKAMNPDVLLGPHPEVYGMQAKRAQMKDGAPNPFVKPGELATYIATLETDFDAQLAKQTAALKNQ